MRIENIRVGMVLRLKRERQEAYGMDSPLVRVTELRPHKCYKRTWVLSGSDFYKTQDFECSVGFADYEALRVATAQPPVEGKAGAR